MENEPNRTIAGTDINEVKRQNANSGLTYNQVKELIAKTGGKGTAVYSDTNPELVKKQIERGQS
ncbi:gamma-type small acid-soluble spore protein [Sporosarcina sp. Te-1]|uniref:gamma-type small acid-soluble spore protein n=1 Tax=Sporosarcina sp. Te-1 TaxID=2818390 RepID=UPI001A9D5470|nr:gamma-type small acid-soluble spore protein [Sporosarcina sp. Te-1]QTD39909.1 gamma-type small acid-soluble spore protein [Sporosarcina sp. Te-1]